MKNKYSIKQTVDGLYSVDDGAVNIARGLTRSDAYLFVAGPELLGALKLVLEETGIGCYCDNEKEYACGRCKARKALSKAQGGAE